MPFGYTSCVVKPFGLQKYLMARLAGEPVNLVFDRRAIARADAFDHSRIHRRAIQIGADHIVRLLVGVRDPTRHLPRMLLGRSKKRKHRHRIGLAQLLFARREIDRAAVDARRCPRLQPALRKLHLLQARGERNRSGISGAACGVVIQSDMDQPVQKCSGGQHHRRAAESGCPTASPRRGPCRRRAEDRQRVAGTATDSVGFRAGHESPGDTAPDRLARASRAPPDPSSDSSIRN